MKQFDIIYRNFWIHAAIGLPFRYTVVSNVATIIHRKAFNLRIRELSQNKGSVSHHLFHCHYIIVGFYCPSSKRWTKSRVWSYYTGRMTDKSLDSALNFVFAGATEFPMVFKTIENFWFPEKLDFCFREKGISIENIDMVYWNQSFANIEYLFRTFIRRKHF